MGNPWKLKPCLRVNECCRYVNCRPGLLRPQSSTKSYELAVNYSNVSWAMAGNYTDLCPKTPIWLGSAGLGYRPPSPGGEKPIHSLPLRHEQL
jgi:hypothetical protein